MSSILFLRSRISFSLFFNFSSCYFFVSAIVSLFFSILTHNYSVLPLFPPVAVPAIPVRRCTLSAFACTDGSWRILVKWVVHDGHHFFLFCFEVSLEVHYSFFDLVLACPILVGSLLLKHCVRSNIPCCFCKSCTLLFRIWTLSASSSGPSPALAYYYPFCFFWGPFKTTIIMQVI